MDLTTIQLILGAAGIVALSASWIFVKKRQRRDSLIEVTKERAAIRAAEKAAELARQKEQGMSEIPSASLDVGGVDVRPILFDTNFGEFIDDTHDGRGKLTDEQKETIALINQGIVPSIKVEKKKHLVGVSLNRRAGIPERDSIFSEFNTVDPAWADTDPNFGRR